MRNLTFAMNKATMVWMGPAAEEVQADFERFFKRSVECTGDVFLVASRDEVRDYQLAMAQMRGKILSKEAREQAPLSQTCQYTGAQIARLQEYEANRPNPGFGGRGTWFADIDQHYKRGSSTPGTSVPCQLTHSTVHAWAADRAMLPMELFLAHGFNVYPGATENSRECCINGFLRQLSRKQQQELLGNGWHLPTVAMWTMYCLAHVAKVSRRCTLQPERSLLQKGGSQLWGPGDEVDEDD